MHPILMMFTKIMWDKIANGYEALCDLYYIMTIWGSSLRKAWVLCIINLSKQCNNQSNLLHVNDMHDTHVQQIWDFITLYIHRVWYKKCIRYVNGRYINGYKLTKDDNKLVIYYSIVHSKHVPNSCHTHSYI